MSVEQYQNNEYQNNEMTMDVCLSPSLESAIRNWQVARLALQYNPGKDNLDNYMLRCDELGQSIGSWAASETELAFEFGNWFRSHEEDWAL